MEGSWKPSMECEIGQRQKVGRSGNIGSCGRSYGHLACVSPEPHACPTTLSTLLRLAPRTLDSSEVDTLSWTEGQWTAGIHLLVYQAFAAFLA